MLHYTQYVQYTPTCIRHLACPEGPHQDRERVHIHRRGAPHVTPALYHLRCHVGRCADLPRHRGLLAGDEPTHTEIAELHRAAW